MKYLSVAIVAMMCLSDSVGAFACDEVLKLGIWETQKIDSHTYESAEFSNWACNNSSASASLSIPGVGKGSGSKAQGKCSTRSNRYIISHAFREELRKASPGILQAWTACMTGFYGARASILYRQDLRNFTILLSHRTNKPATRAVLVSAQNFACNRSPQEMARGIRVPIQESVSCTRGDLTQPIVIDVRYPDGYPGQSLYIPGVAASPTIDEIKSLLVGQYHVVFRGGRCGPPRGPGARIVRENGVLVAYNECNSPTSVSVNSPTEIGFFGQEGRLEIDDGRVKIIADDRNEWWKTN